MTAFSEDMAYSSGQSIPQNMSTMNPNPDFGTYYNQCGDLNSENFEEIYAFMLSQNNPEEQSINPPNAYITQPELYAHQQLNSPDVIMATQSLNQVVNHPEPPCIDHINVHGKQPEQSTHQQPHSLSQVIPMSSLGQIDNLENGHTNQSNASTTHMERYSQHPSLSDNIIAISFPVQIDQVRESNNPGIRSPGQSHISQHFPEQDTSAIASPSPKTDTKRRVDPSIKNENEPKKRTRGPNKIKRLTTAKEQAAKKVIQREKNKSAALKCRNKKKAEHAVLKQKVASLENHHHNLRQEVQNGINQLSWVVDGLRRTYHNSKDFKLSELIQKAETTIMTLSQATGAFDSVVASIDQSTADEGGHAMSRQGSESSIGSEVGETPPSRSNSIKSNESDTFLHPDSGVSDIGTPDLSHPPPSHAIVSTTPVGYATIGYAPVGYAPASHYPYPQMIPNQRIHGQPEIFIAGQCSSLPYRYPNQGFQ